MVQKERQQQQSCVASLADTLAWDAAMSMRGRHGRAEDDRQQRQGIIWSVGEHHAGPRRCGRRVSKHGKEDLDDNDSQQREAAEAAIHSRLATLRPAALRRKREPAGAWPALTTKAESLGNPSGGAPDQAPA